ncbi:TetR/AcrR family transcriptional regulator [Limosilactobacillus antri]|uniref:TetR/AcrR family transcriptional regulator n=1 Tax=Limosilactobacillus antri TaxID=227943 RepID=UPI001F5937AE|nr:TetR/AcrR family transcriptional regulator [Limosilactobacillus antri]
MSDMRKIRTRREIQQAIAELLLQKPFSKITVKDIVDKALINRNTFYLHYRDKYDLIEQILTSMIDQADISVNDFIHQPFYFFQTIMNNTSAVSKKIIDRQKKDQAFHEVILRTVLHIVMKNNGENDAAWFTFGKVSAIMSWNTEHGYRYSIGRDVKTLQKIYETEKFPK